ncbi:MAG: hypothetical protein BMS9Abin29_0814 [Gemmatimonadota bacterium]|nr:MAG: hypothetical protein BMS9Abin29_0814 [Gemmatimonadota bacterium]
MDVQRFLIATVVGGVTLFVVGFLVYGLALANAYPETGIDREAPLWLWLILTEFAWAALLTVILSKWPGGSTAGGGFMAAALVGLLISIAFGLGFYAMTTLPTSVMSYIDPFVSAVVFGTGGAAIGWSLGRGAPQQV